MKSDSARFGRRLTAALVAMALGYGGCVQVLGDFSTGNGSEGDGGTDSSVDASTEAASDAPSDLTVGGDDAETSADASSDGGVEPDAMSDGGCAVGDLACDGGCVPDDLHNCGACGNDCTKLHNVNAGSLACTGGKCVYQCAGGYADCADAGDGCDADLAQQGNCGACGVTCGGATPVCTTSGGTAACGTGCSANEILCSGSCVDPTTSVQDCGGCNMPCTTGVANAQPSCANSRCGYTCDPTYTSCANGCWDTSNDANHCGSSCAACPGVSNGQPVCSSGACGFACNAGYGPCAGGCYATQTDPNHCGASCAVCSGGEVCSNGSCTCPASAPNLCNGTCVDEQSDANNCGACGHSCLGGACTSGACQPVTLVTLSGPPNTARAEIIGVDATNVYFDGGGGAMKCSINGCASGTLIYTPNNDAGYENLEGFATPNASSPYNSFVFVLMSGFSANQSYMATVHSATGVGTTYPLGALFALTGAFDSVNSWIYYADGGDGHQDGALRRVKPDGTLDGLVLGGLGPPIAGSNPAVDATNAYISTDTSVYYCPLNGSCSSSNVVFSSLVQPEGVASNGAYVFATEHGSGTTGGAVYRCPINTNCGKPTPFVAGQSSSISDVLVDANDVYWRANGDIWRCPVAGCNGSPTMFATSALSAQVAQDASAIYFANSVGIVKVAK